MNDAKFIFFLGLMLAFGCQDQTTTPPTNDSAQKSTPPTFSDAGTQAMIDSLESIYRRTDFRNHPYATVEAVKISQPAIDQMKKNNQVNLQAYISFGLQLLNAGRVDEAIRIVEEVKSQLPYLQTVNQNSKAIYETLAVAYLRKGEIDNCIANHNEESCIVPINQKAYHQLPDGSRKAIELYQAILAVFPDDLQSRWLLNVAYMTLGEYPGKVPPALLIPLDRMQTAQADFPKFRNSAMDLGLDINELAGGVIIDDFNNDNWLDLMISSWGMKDQLRYFQNTGTGSFEELTKPAGLSGLTGGLNLKQADFDNDGHLDFLVLRGAWNGITKMGIQPNSLIRNNGNGTFSDVTIQSGLYTIRPSQSAEWMDADLDGDLDLFIANETSTELESFPCEFYINQGDGTFSEVAQSAGLGLTGFIKGTTGGDFNDDGYPDLYISFMNQPNQLWINGYTSQNKRITFNNKAKVAGVEEPVHSFPCWVFDYNNDGLEDLFVAAFDELAFKNQSAEFAADLLGQPFQSAHPILYENQGNARFKNVTRSMGLDRAAHVMGCNYGDLDNDGYLDFYLGTGAPDYRAVVPNRMFWNRQGKQFSEVTSNGHFGHIQKGHGISFGDLDNDGDQDIYAVMGGSFSGDNFQNTLFENPGNKNDWVILKLVGTSSNRSAIGARIRLSVQNQGQPERNIYATLNSGASFGANSLRQEIGLGPAATISDVAINWPNGQNTYVSYGPIPNKQLITIQEGSEKPSITELKKAVFTTSSGHEHHHH